MVDHKGLSGEGDNGWLVKDMQQELKLWGYPGGAENALILKGDREPAVLAVREALARCHGGNSLLSSPCWGAPSQRPSRRGWTHHSRPCEVSEDRSPEQAGEEYRGE
ncbi:hypothetical protein N9L68_01600 [bacterium]|nr:hypothetical protein [bacterium]